MTAIQHRRETVAIQLPIDIDQVKGFLAEDEAEALYNAAIETAPIEGGAPAEEDPDEAVTVAVAPAAVATTASGTTRRIRANGTTASASTISC